MGEFWHTKPDYIGRAVCLVAGGPSLSLRQVRTLGMARAADLIRVIAINDAAYPCWFADAVYACDSRFWKFHRGMAGFKGIRVSCDDSGFPGIRFLKNTGTEGFDPAPGCIRTGGNSGYQAVQLAMHLGASRIILVGFDMVGKPQEHWFGAHPEAIKCKALTQEHRVKHFAALKPELMRRGIDVVNVSDRSALTFFRQATLESLFPELE